MEELYLRNNHLLHVYNDQNETSQLYVIVILIRFDLRKIRYKVEPVSDHKFATNDLQP